jgi:hypothetical protein
MAATQRGLPLAERKRRLREIVPRAPSSSPLLYVDHGIGTGINLFTAVSLTDLEGHSTGYVGIQFVNA